MSTPAAPALQSRANKRGKPRLDPLSAGLPDPRPLTDYVVDWQIVHAGLLRLSIALDQPCIIRAPQWSLVDYRTGERYQPLTVKVQTNTTFDLDFDAATPAAANFVEPPYQDEQVQNFQGGFVRPGARWFRYLG